MASTLAHRGSDDEGILVSASAGLAFSRLSIIDLAGGHQPLANGDETVWTVFNGEIYNYRQLRRTLRDKGHTFRSESDTEVIVHLYEEYGDDFVNHVTGMFGLAIWDTKWERLVLARDRAGIKPMYYAETPDGLTFGSEIKAILEDPSVPRKVDIRALDRFLSFYYLPGEGTLFDAIKKLEPGHLLVYENGSIATERYWDMVFDPETGSSPARDRALLVDLLDEVVADHLIADVPVGLLLSGGVDSTALLALAAAQGAELSTFTIGFSGEHFADERPYARLAADRYGTNHYETSMDRTDFLTTLPRYVCTWKSRCASLPPSRCSSWPHSPPITSRSCFPGRRRRSLRRLPKLPEQHLVRTDQKGNGPGATYRRRAPRDGPRSRACGASISLWMTTTSAGLRPRTHTST
jgi:asparagine synthase (glutamine-hydrolysing)